MSDGIFIFLAVIGGLAMGYVAGVHTSLCNQLSELMGDRK